MSKSGEGRAWQRTTAGKMAPILLNDATMRSTWQAGTQGPTSAPTSATSAHDFATPCHISISDATSAELRSNRSQGSPELSAECRVLTLIRAERTETLNSRVRGRGRVKVFSSEISSNRIRVRFRMRVMVRVHVFYHPGREHTLAHGLASVAKPAAHQPPSLHTNRRQLCESETGTDIPLTEGHSAFRFPPSSTPTLPAVPACTTGAP